MGCVTNNPITGQAGIVSYQNFIQLLFFRKPGTGIFYFFLVMNSHQQGDK